MNSQLFWFFIQNTGYVLRGGYYTFKTDYIQPFPVPEIIPDTTYLNVSEMVERIIDAKSSSINNDTSVWEKAIDEYVYSLYNLDGIDIALIETEIVESTDNDQ